MLRTTVNVNGGLGFDERCSRRVVVQKCLVTSGNKIQKEQNEGGVGSEIDEEISRLAVWNGSAGVKTLIRWRETAVVW
ncbi:uncharacterized protein SPSK_08211 [Sporothrix schenckii 1099-18]|uniref:Uncharacterized protein n=1 Tax=Sporothrix schenckii 1099-18 TaxID=1397361 RepID=A0A0F2MHC7_SPOSC|nr:uncharacterized protein SPSK_08211 [Sporothrix schenckii 1099-18]KJR89027.1 hypothetical protein SPSK_08211 [Sporothrix schenckii 1099-18]